MLVGLSVLGDRPSHARLWWHCYSPPHTLHGGVSTAFQEVDLAAVSRVVAVRLFRPLGVESSMPIGLAESS